MDDLDRREAFLLAIFASPDDDLPRLVFADWLEENGDAAWAETIRRQCGDPPPSSAAVRRGFRTDTLLPCTAELLSDPVEFRQTALRLNPHWYGCLGLKVSGGLIAGAKPVGTILHSPVTQRVTALDLSGRAVTDTAWSMGGPSTAGEDDPAAGESYQLSDFVYRPVVTVQAVEALVGARECRRFTTLDLTNNDLDNDAARAILKSPYLTRLNTLRLFDGNQLRGKTWAQLRDKFGEEVVT
jgi:uncharacterized protein (TIGR02996 family)